MSLTERDCGGKNGFYQEVLDTHLFSFCFLLLPFLVLSFSSSGLFLGFSWFFLFFSFLFFSFLFFSFVSFCFPLVLLLFSISFPFASFCFPLVLFLAFVFLLFSFASLCLPFVLFLFCFCFVLFSFFVVFPLLVSLPCRCVLTHSDVTWVWLGHVANGAAYPCIFVFFCNPLAAIGQAQQIDCFASALVFRNFSVCQVFVTIRLTKALSIGECSRSSCSFVLWRSNLVAEGLRQLGPRERSQMSHGFSLCFSGAEL